MYKAIKYVYPAFRLAEVYLNYAEACNEKPQRDETAALLYLNKVRNRVGLKDIEEAYPEIKGNKELRAGVSRKSAWSNSDWKQNVTTTPAAG